MATFLYKLGRLCFKRRWWVALLWIALMLGIGFASTGAGESSDDSFAMSGTESQDANDLLNKEFPQSNADALTTTVVFQAEDGEKLTSADNRAAVEDLLDELADGSKVTDVTSVDELLTPGMGTVNESQTTAYATVTYSVSEMDVTQTMRDDLTDAMDHGRDDGLTVEASGSVAEEESVAATEGIGVLVAAVVLVITFGSLVAAGLPLITALIGVAITSVGITALASTLDLSSTTSSLATMIGLAVGIDYALFIAFRYRAELIAGHSREEAAGRAVGTAGTAVVFAGLTVIIALSGLSIIGVSMLTKMGLVAAAAVIVAVLIALTLVPAALGIVGKRIFGRKLRKQNPQTGIPVSLRKNGKEPMGTRWARGVLRRPGLVLAGSVIGLGVLAIPVYDLQLGIQDDGSAAEDTTQRKAYDLLSEGFGAGYNGQLTIVVQAKDGTDLAAAVETVSEAVDQTDGVVEVGQAAFNDDQTVATFTATPSTGPQDEETTDLVNQIRDDAGSLEQETGTTVYVTGQTAISIDFSQTMTDALVPYLAIVVGLAFLLLIVVFRSILVPLKAALGFLLSVMATLGILVAVFQWGWGVELLGSSSGPIMSMVPIFIIGVVFGLAMDYEVFLVTRMREAYIHGEDPRQAIITGFNLNARVVTAAAIIMGSVFAGFALSPGNATLQMMGGGLAAAVLLDAFVVRMTLVPALMGLLGRRAWGLPKVLDRVVPNVDVEGDSLERYLESQGRGRSALQQKKEEEQAKKEREPQPVG